MVVISRLKDTSIVIGDGIIVTVIEIRGDKVRLGIEHPPGATVHRKEVYDAIRRQDPPVSAPAVSPTEPLKPHFAERQPDKLDKLAAALKARLGVSVDRDLVIQALRDAGIEELAMQTNIR